MEHVWEALWHTAKDTLPLLPFLYVTYLAMEALERYAGERTERTIRRAGRAGPALGGLLGALPQCGFSASGASFYAARIITPGTLVALFLATSDEMLPVMISSAVSPWRIAKLLMVKVGIGVVVGFLLDAILNVRRHHAQVATKRQTVAGHRHAAHHEEHHGEPHDDDADEAFRMEEICRSGHCHCDEKPIWLAALRHTVSVTLVIYLVSLVLHVVMDLGGDALMERVSALPRVVACLLTSLIGMIPSCASSVALTRLHLSGGLTIGALMAGLLTGAGAGTIVLVRTNRPRKNTLILLALLYAVGVAAGTLIDVTPIHNFLM